MRTALVALALLAAGPATAAGPLAFPSVDLDHDGVVTWEEASRRMPRLKQVHFRKCDLDRDGVIDAQEYPLLSTFYWANYVMPD